MKMPGKPKAPEQRSPQKEQASPRKEPAVPAPAAPAPAAEKSQAASPAQAPPAVEKTESAAPAPPEAFSSPKTEKAAAPELTVNPPPVDKIQNQVSLDDNGNNNGSRSLRALIGLPESQQPGMVEAMLRRQGYKVERLDSWKEQSIGLQQGQYSLVFAHQNGSPKPDGVQSLINTLSPEVRRELFVVLVGDAFKTADGTEAFVAQADLVCRSEELSRADSVLRSTITEKHRLYRAYLEAQSKREAGKL
jgi:hypothetical protein